MSKSAPSEVTTSVTVNRSMLSRPTTASVMKMIHKLVPSSYTRKKKKIQAKDIQKLIDKVNRHQRKTVDIHKAFIKALNEWGINLPTQDLRHTMTVFGALLETISLSVLEECDHLQSLKVSLGAIAQREERQQFLVSKHDLLQTKLQKTALDNGPQASLTLLCVDEMEENEYNLKLIEQQLARTATQNLRGTCRVFSKWVRSFTGDLIKICEQLAKDIDDSRVGGAYAKLPDHGIPQLAGGLLKMSQNGKHDECNLRDQFKGPEDLQYKSSESPLPNGPGFKNEALAGHDCSKKEQTLKDEPSDNQATLKIDTYMNEGLLFKDTESQLKQRESPFKSKVPKHAGPEAHFRRWEPAFGMQESCKPQGEPDCFRSSQKAKVHELYFASREAMDRKAESHFNQQLDQQFNQQLNQQLNQQFNQQEAHFNQQEAHFRISDMLDANITTHMEAHAAPSAFGMAEYGKMPKEYVNSGSPKEDGATLVFQHERPKLTREDTLESPVSGHVPILGMSKMAAYDIRNFERNVEGWGNPKF